MSVAEIMAGAPQAAIDLIEGLEARDVARIEAVLAEDVEWTMVGGGERFPLGGVKAKPELVEILRNTFAGFTSFRFSVRYWAQNGDIVFVETDTQGVGPGQCTYDNIYLIRLTIRNGLIVNALEHYDPFQAMAYLDQMQG